MEIFAFIIMALLLAFALAQLASMQRPEPRRTNRRQYINGAVVRTGHLVRVMEARRALCIGESVEVRG